MRSLAARELAQRLCSREDLQLVDVREQWEWRIAALNEARLVPLGDLPSRVAELDPKRPTVMMCHHGARSAVAGNWLENAGFADINNLTGGIDAWSREVDPTLPRY